MLFEKMKLDVIDEVRFTLVTFLTNRVFCVNTFAGYYCWFTPARYTYKNYHSNAKYMIKCNIAVHMVMKIQTSDK
jgi:hypothetical protein